MKVCVILPAAGFSARFSEGLALSRSKLDEDLGGRPVLQRTVELFTKRDEVASIVVAGPFDDEAFGEFKLRHADKLAMLGASVCKGGKTHRYETVKAALEHVPEGTTHVAVHDAARPCTPPELLDRIFDAAQQHPAVVPGIEVADTIKRLGDEAGGGSGADPIADLLGAPSTKAEGMRTVRETVDRKDLVCVQTPQVFEYELLKRAYAQDDLTSTDDAGLVERLGEPVVVVEGDPRNLKITRPHDVPLARAILGLKGPQGRATHKKF